MDYDPYIHKDKALFDAIEDLFYYLMAMEQDDFLELELDAEIEVILEEFHYNG